MSKASSRTFERGFVFHLSWNVTPRVCGDADLAQEWSDFVQAVIKGVWKSPFVVGKSRGGKVVSVVSGEADLARDLSGLCFVMLFWFVTMSLELDYVKLVSLCTLFFSCTYTYTCTYTHAHWCHANETVTHIWMPKLHIYDWLIHKMCHDLIHVTYRSTGSWKHLNNSYHAHAQ